MLLAVIVLSMFYVGSYPSSKVKEPASSLASTLAGTPASPIADAAGGSGADGSSYQAPVYPNSVNGGAPLSSGTGAQTDGPLILDYHGIKDAQNLGIDYPLPGNVSFTGSGVRAAVVDYGADIGHPDLNGSQFIEPAGMGPTAYQGWPVAFDPKSMGIFLRDKKYEGTWYANTTRFGSPPFEVTHGLIVDGRNDFGPSEALLDDPVGQSIGALSPDGGKFAYDLTYIYATHDDKSWYFGFPLSPTMDTNISLGLLIDVNNETSGTTTVPEGRLVNTETTHSGWLKDDLAVNDVKVSPDGTMVATCGDDSTTGGLVKVWWVGNATRRYELNGHGPGYKPYSLAWSPDSRYLASRDSTKVIVWDIAGGGRIFRTFTFAPTMDITPSSDLRYSSSLSFSPDGTLVAVSHDVFVTVFNVTSNTKAGDMKVATGGLVKAVAFSPSNLPQQQIAVGVDAYIVDQNTVRVFTLNATNYGGALAKTYWSGQTLGAGAEIYSVAWSPDGAKIASASRGGLVRLWSPPATAATMSATLGTWAYSVAWEKGVSPPTSARFAAVSANLVQRTQAPIKIWDYSGNLVSQFNLSRTAFAVDWTTSHELFTATLDLTAKMWDTSGTLKETLVAHKPDYAVMIDAGLNYSLKDLAWQKVVSNGSFYSWNGVSWGVGHEITKAPINGSQAFFGIDQVFVEVGVPQSILGHPKGLSVELFTCGTNRSHAQDATPRDYNVFDLNGDGQTDRATKALDWTAVQTPLAGFQYVPVKYYTVDTAAIRSAGGVYHFGYHPSPQIAQTYGSLGLLVVDSTQPGKFDTVYLDMNNDKRFDARDIKVNKAQPVATLTDITGKVTSAGMIYFIADGENYLPYSERFRTLNGITDNNKPLNGSLVAFAGEFRVDPTTNEADRHGTEVASVIVGRGVDPANMIGIAPQSKLIQILNGPEDVISSWYFAVEGYDGQTGSGDEAQILVNPFEYPRTRNDGFDVYSRTADYLSMSYSGGKTIFFGPSGEDGFGYGSVASPSASPGIITVGRTTDYTRRASPIGQEGPHFHYKDIASTSSRGPTVSGFPKPDLVAIGNPAVDLPTFYGTNSLDIPPGAEFSAAVVAGVSALLVEANSRVNVKQLTATDVRNYLMSGADNLGYDILQQGAGFLNASRSMRLLIGNRAGAGVYASPPSWVPGTYKGTKPGAYTKLVFPGDNDTQSFTLRNGDTAGTTVGVSANVLEKFGEYKFSNTTIRKWNNDMFLWVNRSGVFVPDDVGAFPTPRMIAGPIDPAIWDSSDMVKLTAYTNFTELIVPSGIDTYTNLYCYDLVLEDWAYDQFGYGYPALINPFELNTIDEFAQTSNVLESRVFHPAKEVADSLVVELKGHLNIDACRKSNQVWNFKLEFFHQKQWSWFSFDNPSVTIQSGTTATVTARVVIPPGTAMGSYEGAIYLHDSLNNRDSIIPVLVSAGAKLPNFRFGGSIPDTDLYDANRIYGGRDMTLLGTTVRYTYLGDWRFFYLLLPDEGLYVAGTSVKMVIQLNWTTKPSDIDLLALTPAAAGDLASQGDSGRFGPKSLIEVAASEAESKPVFKTLSNTSQDYISYQLAGGLNAIGLHEMILAGNIHFETIIGSGMWWRVPREMRVATQSLAGSMTGSAMVSENLYGGMGLSAVGPAITSENNSELIKQDWQDWMRALSFGNALAKGSYTYCIILKKVLILDVKMTGLPDVNDLDLGLFRDTNDNCKLDEAQEITGNPCVGLNCVGSGPLWAYSGGPTADEEIKWVQPPDGRYIIKVLGFDVPGGAGHFNLKVSQTLDTGTGYQIPEAPRPAQIHLGTLPYLVPFKIINFSMAWDFPGNQEDGNYSGAVQFGTSTATGIIVVPCLVILDRLVPAITKFSVLSVNYQVNQTDPTLTNDPKPTIVVSMNDTTMGTLDRTTFRMVLDRTNDVTSMLQVSLVLKTSPFVAPGLTGPWGYWEGDLLFVPLSPLDNGVHTMYVRIGDEARNYVHQNFTFRIDLSGPSLSLTNPATEYTKQATAVIRGQTDPLVYVNVKGVWTRSDAAGAFSIPVSLQAGRNVFDIAATKWFMTVQGSQTAANEVSIQKEIVYDTIPPEIVAVTTEPGGPSVKAQSVTFLGQVKDDIALNTHLDPSLLTVYVNGQKVPVLPDGTFSTIVPLQQGANTILMNVTDMAGSTVDSAPVTVTRDTTAPTITVDAPDKVESQTITVTVSTETGIRVTVNGFVADESSPGVYTREVSLSSGSNDIVVRAEDAAGNVAEMKKTVVYTAPSGLGSLLFGPGGGLSAIGFMIILVVIVVIVVLVLLWVIGGRRGKEEGEVEAEEVPPTEEEVEEEEALREEKEVEEAERIEEELIAPPVEPPAKPMEEEHPEKAAEPTPTLVEFRVTRAKRALDAGNISRSVYEQNLSSMGLTVADADRILGQVRRREEGEAAKAASLSPPQPPAQTVGPEVKAARLKAAYGAGRISREVYEDNLRTLGLLVPQAEPAEVKKGPSKEDRRKALRRALDEGKISEEVYEENLRKIGES